MIYLMKVRHVFLTSLGALLAGAGVLLPVQLSALPIPSDDDPALDGRGFFDNPNENRERKARAKAYREFYEANLADQFDDADILKRFFAPRVFGQSFDTNLPSRQARGRWSLRLSPKFSDFLKKEHVRVPVRVSYDFSNWFEAFTDVGTYFSNPFDNGGSSGFYNWRLGAKYSWVGVAGSDYSVAIGAQADMPFSDPPLELKDGYARYEPYLSISKHLPQHQKWLVYLNLAYEFVNRTPFQAKSISPQPRDRQFIRPGAIYYPGGNFRYSVEVEYRTNILDFRNDYTRVDRIPETLPEYSRYENWVLAHREVHEVVVHPAITWFPTREVRDGLIIPGNWDLGIRLDLPIIEETREDFGLSVRFRWYYDYRKFIAQDLRNLFNRDR